MRSLATFLWAYVLRLCQMGGWYVRQGKHLYWYGVHHPTYWAHDNSKLGLFALRCIRRTVPFIPYKYR